MEAKDFKDRDFQRTMKGVYQIDIQKFDTSSVKLWYVSVFNVRTSEIFINQPFTEFENAKSKYESLIKNLD